MLWGLVLIYLSKGTAIGELPPYFVARAGIIFIFTSAAIAGSDNESFNYIEKILQKEIGSRSFIEQSQIIMHRLVTSLGFLGIFICAAVIII
jgi:hypothetical protein